MTIKGTLQVTKTNDYGFTAVKMGGAWYGADKKGFKPDAQEGDLVEFEAFANAKGYQTYKAASFKRVSAAATGNASVSQPTSESKEPGTSAGKPLTEYQLKEKYWADKEARDIVRAKADEAKDPRIVYQSSYERAIAFTDLAIRNGAFEALAKAKASSRLEVLQSFVDEQAARILGQVYLAEVPTAKQPTVVAKATAEPVAELESDESWA